MKYLFLLIGFFGFISALNAAELGNDSGALRACRFMPTASVRNLCFDYVKGHRFNSVAVGVCTRSINYGDDYGPAATECLREIRDQEYDNEALGVCERLSDPGMMDCLRMIAGRKTTPRALSPCYRIWGDGPVMACLRQVTWAPIFPEGSGSLLSNGEGSVSTK